MQSKKRKLTSQQQSKTSKKSKHKKKSLALSSTYDKNRNQYSKTLAKSARVFQKHAGYLPPLCAKQTRERFVNAGRGDGGVSGDPECMICRNVISQSTTPIPCGHEFCGPCIMYWFVVEKKVHDISSCPTCRTQVEKLQNLEGMESKVPYIPKPPRRRSGGSEKRKTRSKTTTQSKVKYALQRVVNKPMYVYYVVSALCVHTYAHTHTFRCTFKTAKDCLDAFDGSPTLLVRESVKQDPSRLSRVPAVRLMLRERQRSLHVAYTSREEKQMLKLSRIHEAEV